MATVRDTLARSAPLDAVLVVQDARLDPDRLESLIRAQADRVVPGTGLSEPAQAQYDRMLQVACAQVVEFITARREFSIWVQRQLVQQTGAILDQVDDLAATVAQDVVRADAAARRSDAEDGFRTQVRTQPQSRHRRQFVTRMFPQVMANPGGPSRASGS